MLPIGIVHPRMGDHRNPSGLGQVTDLDDPRDAAAPEYIRLEDIDQPPAGRGGKGIWQIPMFATGQGLPRQPLTDGSISIEGIGHDIILDPL